MSILDELRNVFELNRNMIFKKYRRINPISENLVDWKKKGEFLFGKKNITVYDLSFISGEVEVGENSWIGPYTVIDGGGGVKIGANCSISSGVQIVSHDTVKWALSGGELKYEYGPIEIGDNCFIGTHAVVTKGVKIGKHCLIGAGSIVTKNLPDYSIAFGIPAKVIGKVVVSDNDVVFEYFK